MGQACGQAVRRRWIKTQKLWSTMTRLAAHDLGCAVDGEMT